MRAAPIEGAAVLAFEAAERLPGLDSIVLEAARVALDRPGISVVKAAFLAAEVGVTAFRPWSYLSIMLDALLQLQ